jgi:hypothetical protein
MKALNESICYFLNLIRFLPHYRILMFNYLDPPDSNSVYIFSMLRPYKQHWLRQLTWSICDYICFCCKLSQTTWLICCRCVSRIQQTNTIETLNNTWNWYSRQCYIFYKQCFYYIEPCFYVFISNTVQTMKP